MARESGTEQAGPFGVLFWRIRLGAKLRELRLRRGLSLRDLERSTSVSHSEIYKIEAGRQDCRLESYVRVCSALGVPPGKGLDDLLTVDPFPSAKRMASIVAESPTLAQFAAIASTNKAACDIYFLWLGAYCAFVVQLLLSANAKRKGDTATFPSPRIRRVMRAFAERVDSLADEERNQLLIRIEQRPIEELRAQGLLTPGIIGEILAEARKPASNRRTFLHSFIPSHLVDLGLRAKD